MNAKLLLQGLVLATSLVALPEVTFAQNKRMEQMTNVKNNSFELRIDKNMTDAQLKQDETDAKKFDFEVSFSGVKRNDKKEITAIKIAYKDKDGNSGNYNVGSDKPIAPISIAKYFDGTGKGSINIHSGDRKNDMFGNFGDGFGPGGFEMLFKDDRFQNLNQDMFKGLLDNEQFTFTDKFGDLEKLREFKGFDNDSLGGDFEIFRFNDGEMQMDNPDMKLEEETEKDGMITKKYSDGKGNTMIFSEKKWSSDGKMDDLDKMKSDLGDQKKKIQIERKYNTSEDSKADLENLKKELEKTKADLEKLKTDLQKDKGTKGKK